jgi:hypothetical protein
MNGERPSYLIMKYHVGNGAKDSASKDLHKLLMGPEQVVRPKTL